uniref:DUF4393 domain-containing protein n=1 Tax=Halomonas sp. 3F2F TaxID=1255602 RepID=UPI001D02A475
YKPRFIHHNLCGFTYMGGENIYEPLENHAKETYSQLENKLQDQEVKFKRGTIEITPFARLFINACFSNI